jgi:hypothetical protein
MSEWLPERETLVLNALQCAVLDTNVLVQRTALDLLLQHFALHEHVFTEKELVTLLIALLRMQLRKEVSLNRRLHQWLLGRESRLDYFVAHAKSALVSAVQCIFEQPLSDVKSATETFQILSALLDKLDIGQEILHDILEYPLQTLHRYREGYSFSHEVVALVNQLLDDIKRAVVWDWLQQRVAHIFTTATSDAPLPLLLVVETLLDKLLHINSAEVQSTHLPRLFTIVLDGLTHLVQRRLLFGALSPALRLSLKMLGKIHSTATPLSSSASSTSSTPLYLQESILRYQRLYVELVGLLTPHWNTTTATATTTTTTTTTSASDMRTKVFWCSSPAIELFDLASQLLVSLHSHFKVDAVSSVSLNSSSPSPSSSSSLSALRTPQLPEWFLITVTCTQVSSFSSSQCCLLLFSSPLLCLSPCVVSDTCAGGRMCVQHANPLVACLAARTFIALMTLPSNAEFTPQLQKYVIYGTRHCHTVAKRVCFHLTLTRSHSHSFALTRSLVLTFLRLHLLLIIASDLLVLFVVGTMMIGSTPI